MKIVQVVSRYPPQTGGLETHVKEVSERLADRGHDVTVLTADAGEGGSTMETRAGVEVIRHNGVAPQGAFHIAPGILRTLRHYDADIVHAHNYHSLPLLFAAISAQQSRFVATPHYHGGSDSSIRDSLLSMYRPIGTWALRQADTVVAVSEWECNQLRDDFGTDATVIPNGIDRERFRDVKAHQQDCPYLLTVGRLEEYKGIQYVIRALTDLPEYDLLVAGSGSCRTELERIAAKEGVRDRVKFLGYVEDDVLPELYAGADVYVTLSSFEAYGMTVAEALATGTPCVVRERGGLMNWVKRSDCVGITDTASMTVARAVSKAVGRETDPDTLPTWDDVVDTLETHY